jgi:hypothetical protein
LRPIAQPRTLFGVTRVLLSVAILQVVACSSSAETPAGTTSSVASSGAGGAGGAGGSGPCANAGGAPAYFAYQDGQCGRTSKDGSCTARPFDCTGAAPKAVCGCDGVVHPTACEANLKSIDLDHGGNCQPPTGTFVCDALLCDATNSYCEEIKPPAPDAAVFACTPFPAECLSLHTCDCLKQSGVATGCKADADGHLHVTVGM